jgi:hypothetical protein
VTSRGIKIRVKRCYVGLCNIGLTPWWMDTRGVGVQCHRFSVRCMRVYRYTETIPVDIAFQEGESTDLFIGWQNKRAGLYRWRVFPPSFVQLLLYCVMYSRVQHVMNSFNFFFFAIAQPKRDEVTGGWRKLRSEELSDVCSSPSIIRIIKSRRMRWAGHVARVGEKRNAYRLLVGKPEGKRQLGKPR